MNILNQYKIAFSGLKLGKHKFEFEVSKPFFDAFEYSLVKNGDLSVRIELDKQETFMTAQINIEGNIELTCDVCLSHFPGNASITEHIIIKFSEDDSITENTDEIIVLGRKEHELDLSTLIYEYINLSVPHYNRCEKPGTDAFCDQAMIKRLDSLTISNSEEDTGNADPRWEILKKIKNN